jgi:hypothetical protein
MMRTFKLFLLLCCVFSLTACFGSGSGGGGNVRIATNLTQGTLQPPDAKDSAAFDSGFPVGPMTSGTGSLRLIDPQSQVFAEFENADFHETTDDISGHKWLTAEKDMDAEKIKNNLSIFTFKAGDQGPNGTFVADSGGNYVFKGTVTYGGQTLLINDRRASGLALEYATFGAWFYPVSWDGTHTEGGETTTEKTTELVYHPFYDTHAASKIAPNANDAFTGVAHAEFAQYQESGSYISELRSGTATLNIGSLATSGNLTLSFPQAYDIGFINIGISSGGAISHTGGIPTITDNGNTTGISLKSDAIWSSEVELEGQFHGSGSASEAAGIFLIGFKGDKEVQGAFGVKK